MAFRYVDVEEAKQARGVRMVVVGGIPSPWSEAAKGLLHLKGIDWLAVRLDYESESLKSWTGQRSGPVAFFDDERPRDRWNDILLLAERLAPQPALLPADAADRALVLGLSHELMGEQGLVWSRRLQLIHAGLAGAGGFAPPVAKYLGKKYGYTPQAGEAAAGRVLALLRMLAARLKEQQLTGSRYLVGGTLTAADVYAATSLALIRPLPHDVCAMEADTRAAFGWREPRVEAALDDVLLAHREFVYREHLGLPLVL